MIRKSNALFLLAGLVSAAMFSSGDVLAQCSRGGGGGGATPTGSPNALGISSFYSQNPLTSSAYSQGNLMAMQYQHQVLATQRQIANQMYQNVQRQRLAAIEREAQTRPYRVARAEANRDKRAARSAARLRAQGGASSEAYTLLSVHAQ